jgi:hypothetical protein
MRWYKSVCAKIIVMILQFWFKIALGFACEHMANQYQRITNNNGYAAFTGLTQKSGARKFITF